VAREPFQYAVIRVVPRVERGEFVNVGVILFCRTRGFLEIRIELDDARLRAFGTEVPVGELRDHLTALVRVAAGDENAGAVARLPQSERFHWLVAPSSTVIQTSPVHSGLTEDPSDTLERLLRELVRVA
jgi:Protein of unknown function (DUF3037)